MASLEENKASPNDDLAAWRERVDAELGGTSFQEALTRRTYEGLHLAPLYTAAAPGPNQLQGLPGARRRARGWKIAQEVSSPEIGAAATEIRSGLELGVELLWLRIRRRCEEEKHKHHLAPQVGICIRHAGDADRLLTTLGSGPEIVLDCGEDAPTLAAFWVAAAQGRGLDAEQLEGCFGHDPLADLAEGGALSSSVERTLGQIPDLVTWAGREAPAMRCLLVSSVPYHEAGCTLAEELAFALSTGVEYLRRLTGAGFAVEAAARHLDFRFSVGRDLFLEIAKLRAIRALWAKILTAWDHKGEVPVVRIHARTSIRESARLDPWMNLLRGGAQSFSAALGGADTLVTLPFDAAVGASEPSSRRLAATTQHILQAEADLDRVGDPAGGSWFLEALTDQLGREAWQIFRDLEKHGGMARCLLDGRVAKRVSVSAEALQRAVDRRAEPIVGVSSFVNLEAGRLEAKSVEPAAAPESVRQQPLSAGGPPASGPSLRSFRLADRFEALRFASDQWTLENGSRPFAGLVDLGVVPRIEPRVAFIRRMLAAGGIESLDLGTPEIFLREEGLMAAVFFLETVEEFARFRDVAQQFREAGVCQILVSTNSGEGEPMKPPLGIDGFLCEGCDVHAALRSLLRNLGVL